MDDDIPPVGRERDAMIAEACGWTLVNRMTGYGMSPSGQGRRPVAHYSTDLTAAFALGDAAPARMGFEDAYTHNLCTLCAKAGRGDSFGVAHTSADARSAAWIRAWREWKGRQ